MSNYNEYKEMALRSLEGKWTNAVIASFITFFLADLMGSGISVFLEPTAGIIMQGAIVLVLLPLLWGYLVYFLNLIRGEDISYSRLFDGFEQYLRVFLTEFLKALYELLWSLLFVIPGIIKSYSYAMTEFILKDDPNIGSEEAICKSMKMMEGHKMQLFMIDLSMIGWLILSILTLGIGFLFLVPYNYSAHAHFYEDLKNEQTF